MRTLPACNRRIRVLHIVQSLGTGGLENGVVNLANGIDTSRFTIDILCLRYIGELRERLRPGVDVFFDEPTATSIGRSVEAVRHHLKNRNYDIAHTHGWATLLPGYLGARLVRGVRIINGEHGTFFVDSVRRRLSQRLLFRLVDSNCAVSESLRLEMNGLFSVPAERVQTIINGVDVERFRPNESARLAVRESLKIGADEIVFGTVGRLVPVKDYATLIAAFRDLMVKVPIARLVIVGDGPEMAALKGLAVDLMGQGRVIFAGNRDDVPSMMCAFDVFCLTSLREGLSNTLLEAHACGLPAIVTDTGGNAEVVAEGQTGHLFGVGDRTTLTALMRRLATRPEQRADLGAAARQRAVDEFSIAAMVQAYERHYECVLRI